MHVKVPACVCLGDCVCIWVCVHVCVCVLCTITQKEIGLGTRKFEHLRVYQKNSDKIGM